MKKHLSFVLALLMMAYMSWAANVTSPDKMEQYYSSLNNKSGATLFSQLTTVTSTGYKSVSYAGLYDAYKKTDAYPKDSVGKAGKLWDMYSDCGFEWGRTCGSYSEECDCYNREHSIPQSSWGGGTGNQGCDLFHVVPTDGKVNGVRSNYAYGEVTGTPQYKSKKGLKKGSGGSILNSKATICAAAGSSTPCSAGTVFEPTDEFKGDFARGYLGTIMRWNTTVKFTGSSESKNVFSGNYNQAGNYGLTAYGVALLMKWHRQDPVSQKEIDRNNAIQETQGNRNPFIDYPYLVEYIWGEHAGETVDMAKLMPSCDAQFIPGVSDGWRTDVPVEHATMYGVNWSVNGELLHTDSVKENGQVRDLPAEPQSCSSESETFMGWSPMPIDGIADEEPAVLYKLVNDLPTIVEDLTLYAVFAHAESGGAGTPAVYTYDENNKDGWTNTASSSGNYWLLDQSKVLTSPEVDLAGLKSITIIMRTYGGTQYDEVDVKAGEKLITKITAPNGNKLGETEWKNSQSLTGVSPLTFSTNYGEKKGIGFSSVVINATGAGWVYSRYITSCQSHEEVTNIIVDTPARKVLIGSQIYIMVGDDLFTITGQKVHK